MKETTPEGYKIIKKIRHIMYDVFNMYNTGKGGKALELIKQGEELVSAFHGNMPTELEDPYFGMLRIKPLISAEIGDLTLNLDHVNQLMTIAEKLDNKKGI